MATNEVLITPESLKTNMFNGAFNNTPHRYYVIYDDLMDEFIIKLTLPETLVAAFPISDYYSLLVEPQTFEVVGLQMSEFTTMHLPKLELLNKVWSERGLDKYFSEFRALDYKPQATKTPLTQPKAESYLFVRPEKIDRILATA